MYSIRKSKIWTFSVLENPSLFVKKKLLSIYEYFWNKHSQNDFYINYFNFDL